MRGTLLGCARDRGRDRRHRVCKLFPRPRVLQRAADQDPDLDLGSIDD
jgi:hypothetical protein